MRPGQGTLMLDSQPAAMPQDEVFSLLSCMCARLHACLMACVHRHGSP